MSNDWLDKAKQKAQEAANAAMNAGANLKNAAEQLSHSVTSGNKNLPEKLEEADVPSLLAKVESLLQANLEQHTLAVNLLNEIKNKINAQPK